MGTCPVIHCVAWLQDASRGAGSSAAWAPEVVRDQLQAFRSSDDLLSFFAELKDLIHVGVMKWHRPHAL